MKVILNQAVPKLGKEGQVVTVADGYARNFLFPRKMAILADKNQIAAQARRNERVAAKLADQKAGAEARKTKLDGQTIKLPGKVGTDGTKLFGAITNGDVAEALKAQFGETIERKDIALVQPIKRLGTYAVRVDLHPEVDANINVVVFDPNAPVVEEVAPVAEEEA
jgi:large subunit ribosomal protein L9